MAKSAVASLGVRLYVGGLNKFKAGFQKAQNLGARFASSMKSHLSKAKLGIAGLATGLLGGGFIAAIKNTVARFDTLAKTIKRIGGQDANLFRAIGDMATEAGFSVEGTALALQRMTRGIGEAAAGSGEAKKVLEAMGVSAEDLSKLGLEQQFVELSKVWGKIGSESERVNAAQKLFGREGVMLKVLLDQLAAEEDVNAVIMERIELNKQQGRDVTKKQLQTAEELSDLWSRIGQIFKGTVEIATKELLPTMKEWATSTEEFLRRGGLQEFVKKLAASIGNMSNSLLRIFKSPATDGFIDALLLSSRAFILMVQSAAKVFEWLSKIAEKLDEFKNFKFGFGSQANLLKKVFSFGNNIGEHLRRGNFSEAAGNVGAGLKEATGISQAGVLGAEKDQRNIERFRQEQERTNVLMEEWLGIARDRLGSVFQ